MHSLHDIEALFARRGGIRLQVDAKRCLCFHRPGCRDALPADAQRSLQLQGGVFDAAQAAAFIAQPGAVVPLAPALAHHLGVAARCGLSGGAVPQSSTPWR